MFRRRFFQLMTLATAGGLAPLESAASSARTTVIYRVKGFSCVTCATGLDTMLSQQQGIESSTSTYPEGAVTVSFDPKQTSEKAIATFINNLGFAVEEEYKSDSGAANRQR
jgi:copper chaperone CopZ